jgi:hypothetical protein
MHNQIHNKYCISIFFVITRHNCVFEKQNLNQAMFKFFLNMRELYIKKGTFSK